VDDVHRFTALAPLVLLPLRRYSLYMIRAHACDNQAVPGVAALDALRSRLFAEKPLGVVGLGDSLTYGWMVNQGFFDRFIDRLKETHPRCPVHAVNAGVPGDTAAGGLSRLAGLPAPSPDLVTVQFGLNDMYQGVDANDFKDTLIKIVSRVRGAGAVPVLVTSCPLDWEEGRTLAEAFYGRIRDASRETDAPCASLDVYWKDKAGPPAGWTDLFQADHVHPTDRGHIVMADGLYDAVVGQGEGIHGG
jgi:acyl-CoA thioesterase I